MRKILFTEIATKLASLQDNQSKDLFQFVDYDKGQFQRPGHPQFFPAALISFGRIPTTSYNDDTQLLEATVNVDLYQDAYGDSWHKATDKTITIDALDLMDTVYVALQGFYIEGVSFTSMERSGEDRLRTLPTIWGHRITFQGQFLDNTAVGVQATITKPDPTWLS